MAKVLAYQDPFSGRWYKAGSPQLNGCGNPPSAPGPKHSGRVQMTPGQVEEKDCAKESDPAPGYAAA